MQYTGLKDKNGVEVYEGDIVRTPQTIGYMLWSDARCAFRIKEIVDNPSVIEGNRVIGSDIEVIGNIYENPELLKS